MDLGGPAAVGSSLSVPVWAEAEPAVDHPVDPTDTDAFEEASENVCAAPSCPGPTLPAPASPSKAKVITAPLASGVAETSSTTTFSFNRDVNDGQEVRVYLPAGLLHLIEVQYQDTRPLADLQMSWRKTGGGEFQKFRASSVTLPEVGSATWLQALQLEQQGLIEIRREPDHNAPWIENPIRVQVDIVYPDGRVHAVGKKFLDPHVHDAYSLDSSGSPEVDNISNGYENLPKEPLPEGTYLRLRPRHENRGAWEKGRKTALHLFWVRPHLMPPHGERAVVFEAGDFVKPDSAGFAVEAGRPIAAALVTWTDRGTPESGRLRLRGDGGDVWTPSYNIGSGETELIPLDGKVAVDGKLHVEGGANLGVRRLEVLYAPAGGQ